MKSTSISELKSRLSHYLRRVRRGERILVLDRKEPVAELVPVEEAGTTALERLVREGRVRPPRRRIAEARLTPLGRKIRVQELLDEVRGEAL